MRKPSIKLCMLLIAMALPLGNVRAQAGIKEYQLKAIFLFNFTQFVNWPENAFTNPQSPLTICVLGEDPFGKYLDEAIRGETAHSRVITIQRYKKADEMKTCHILFISKSENKRIGQTLSSLKHKSVLTVGDMDNFATAGGMIRFMNEKNKIKLRINLDAAKAANLTISSKLLRPADIVTSNDIPTPATPAKLEAD